MLYGYYSTTPQRNMEDRERVLFRVIDVYLSDSSRAYSHSSCVRDDAGGGREEALTGPAFVVDETVEQQMRALGLPTRFSSVSLKTASRRPRRRHRSGHFSSLDDHCSQNHCASVNLSFSSESPLDGVHVRAVQLDGHGALDTEANHLEGGDTVNLLRDHREGKSVCVLSDDQMETSVLVVEAIDGCGILGLDARVQADVPTIAELGTLQDGKGLSAHEKAMILDGRGVTDEKETIWPGLVNMRTGHSLELDCETLVVPDEANHCTDATLMACSRIHQEGGNFPELTSIEGACVSLVDHQGASNQEALLVSSGVIDETLSCGMVAGEAIDELGAVLTSRQFPLNNEDLKEESVCRITATKDGSIAEATLRVSNDWVLVTNEAFASSNSRAAAQDDQVSTLSNSNQKVVDERSKASCDARANNLLLKSAEQELLIKDSQTQTPEVLSWSACWDDHYGRYFFYNVENLESTWEPPEGFESYAYISAVEDNNEALQDGFVNGVSNSEELVVDESKEERASSEDGFKSETLLHGLSESEGEALLTVSAVKEALESSVNDLETVQSNLFVGTDGSLPVEEDTVKSPEAALESSFCQIIIQSVSKSGVVQVDAATSKAREPTRRAKTAARWLSRLEDQGMDIAAAMGGHSPTIFKYWAQRFHLFSKYDLGVKLDEEGWFSVTPEAIAKHQAARCQHGVIVDAFTGVGGNAIQFALNDHYVVAIDNDPKKIEYARHNAKIYGVADRIDFVLGDFFAISSSMQADVVFLSPPWGGPDYLSVNVYDIMTMLRPKDGISLFKVAQTVAPNVIFFLPRNVNINQLAELSKTSLSPCFCEVERNYLNGKLKAVTAYYGQFVSRDETCT